MKILGVSDNPAAVEACEAECRQALRSSVSTARSRPYYLDMTHPEDNNGDVVTDLSRSLKIPPAQSATLGDMPNDVLMFEKNGLSIAMGDAGAEVQAQANFVSATNDEEGFAVAFDQFVLKAS